MRTIRTGVFETNSSSTHSITMCTANEYEKWRKGELYYCDYNEEFVTKEERDIILKEMILDDEFNIDWENETITFRGETKSYANGGNREETKRSFLTPEILAEVTQEQIYNLLDEEFYIEEMPCSYDEWYDNIGYETYKREYETKSGEKIVAFGYYGNNY